MLDMQVPCFVYILNIFILMGRTGMGPNFPLVCVPGLGRAGGSTGTGRAGPVLDEPLVNTVQRPCHSPLDFSGISSMPAIERHMPFFSMTLNSDKLRSAT